MKIQDKLNQLRHKIQGMTDMAAHIDRKRGESYRPLFNQQLFTGQAKLLMPCLKESLKLVNTIESESKQGRLSSQHAQHLCERLISQISALQREIATVPIRDKEKYFTPKPPKSINAHYQDLAQHQEWERRLEQMTFDLEEKLNHCMNLSERQHLQQQLVQTEGRLVRCREARLKIENKIHYWEKKQS